MLRVLSILLSAFILTSCGTVNPPYAKPFLNKELKLADDQYLLRNDYLVDISKDQDPDLPTRSEYMADPTHWRNIVDIIPKGTHFMIYQYTSTIGGSETEIVFSSGHHQGKHAIVKPFNFAKYFKLKPHKEMQIGESCYMFKCRPEYTVYDAYPIY